MKKITFIIGGCKSGKSRHALDLANQQAAGKNFFIATAVPFDDEMATRIDRHRKQRGSDWTTVEAPHQLPEAIRANCGENRLILVDCLTLWINNLLMDTTDETVLQEHISKLKNALKQADCPIYLVSNEVGTGIVPENPLARQFRDLAGVINQSIASLADRVVWMVAGIPVQIK